MEVEVYLLELERALFGPEPHTGDEGAEMGVYDRRLRPSLGHKMQVELRHSMQHYHGNKSQLLQQLSELRFNDRDLYTSPTPSSTSSLKRWNEGSKLGPAPEKAIHKAKQAQLESFLTSEPDPESKNTLLPPLIGEEIKSDAKLPISPRPELKDPDQDRKGLRFGASTELKTPHAMKKGKKVGRRKSLLKDKPGAFVRLPTLHSAGKKRNRWDSGHNHLHPKGQSTNLETSRVREECDAFSHRSIPLPPSLDPKRSEIHLPPAPRGLTRANLQAAQRLHRPPGVEVLYNSSSSALAVVEPGEAEDGYFPLPTETESRLDDNNTVVTAASEMGRSTDRLELPPLPVVRLSESKLSGHGLHPTTRHVPRLRSDRTGSPGLLSVTTGRSGATGATGASYLSQETLEWKGEYMNCASRTRQNRMLSEIIQIVRLRMRENEEDLKLAGRDPRPVDMRSVTDDDDVTIWDRHLETASSVGMRSTTRRQRIKKPAARRKKQLVSSSVPQPCATQLHEYLQKLSNHRKATEPRHQGKERVRFPVVNMATIREITQSSFGQPTMAAAAQTPLAV